MADMSKAGNPAALEDIVEQIARSAKTRIPILIAGLVAILLSFAYFAYNLNLALHEAQTARVASDAARIKAESKANELAETLENARRAYETKHFSELEKSLQSAIHQAEQAAQNAQAPSRFAAIVPTLATETSLISDAGPASSGKLFPQKVYIQFAGLIQRSQIVALNNALRDAGWNVQGLSGERTGKAIGLNEVRYSRDNQKAAEALASFLSGTEVVSRRISTREMSIIGQNLEIWISVT